MQPVLKVLFRERGTKDSPATGPANIPGCTTSSNEVFISVSCSLCGVARLLGSSEVTIRAAARGANKHKTRPRALGLALALAAEALGGAAVLAHWTTRQKDLGHGHFETLMAHVLEKWAACV